MFAFEYEPQVSFKNPILAKKKIYFYLSYLKKNEHWKLEDRIISHEKENVLTILLPDTKFSQYMDSSLDFLEVRNTHPFPTIEQALKQINERTEDLAKRLYETLEIPFAFILPASATFNEGRGKWLLSKHLNIDYNCDFGSKLYKYLTQFPYISHKKAIIIRKGNQNPRIHIKVPYRFKDYSLESIENYLQSSIKKSFFKTVEGKYNAFKHEIVGYINDWGEWKWVNKYY